MLCLISYVRHCLSCWFTYISLIFIAHGCCGTFFKRYYRLSLHFLIISLFLSFILRINGVIMAIRHCQRFTIIIKFLISSWWLSILLLFSKVIVIIKWIQIVEILILNLVILIGQISCSQLMIIILCITSLDAWLRIRFNEKIIIFVVIVVIWLLLLLSYFARIRTVDLGLKNRLMVWK